MAQARFETEVLILECVTDIGRQPVVRAFFEKLTKTTKATVSYAPGEEEKLKATLALLHKGLQAAEEERQAQERGVRDERRRSLEQRGLQYLKAGDAPKGKSALRVLADEFGADPGVLTQVGIWLQEAELYFEAAEFLEQAIEAFPRDSKAYGAITNIYTMLREFEKAETVYSKAIKEFGKHPRTMLNLAKLYLAWNKKDKAFEAARDAYKADPGLEEAKAIVDQYS
jgi:Flp pilus assembly protein TadD